MNDKIQQLEKEIFDLIARLQALRKANTKKPVPNYRFKTLDGEVTLLELFGERDKLMLIHNMGQGCRYCTLWADGFNGFVPHLESAMSLVLVSKDNPELQRTFANARGWRFRLASHGGGDYIKEQTVTPGSGNAPVWLCMSVRGIGYSARMLLNLVLVICFVPCGACWVWLVWVRRIGPLNIVIGPGLIAWTMGA
jgi:peroxiredoxin